jgi:hypothetical protein
MSIKLMTAVWDREDLSSTQKLVLLSLADWANDDGLCWPSIERLAIKTSMAGRSVQRIIRDLESMGFVKRNEVLGKGNRYWIHIPMTECHPCPSVTPPMTECHPTPDTVSPNTSKTHQLNTKDIIRVLPDWIPADAWNGWVEMRKQRKKPLTDRAYNKAIEKLVAFRDKGQNITEVLDRSTMNGWTDLYEIKENKNGAANRTTNQRGNQNGFAAALRYVADGRPDEPF